MTDVHPIADDLLGNVLREMVRDRSTPYRVGADAGRTPSRLIPIHRLIALNLAPVWTLACIDTWTGDLVDAISERTLARSSELARE